MKYHFDIAAEMVKIAESAEHQKSMEKLAFSREGKEELSEVEEEMKKLASGDCECNEDKDCKGCDCDCHEAKTDKKEASVSLEDTAGLLLEISTELEDQGMDRLAAATIVLADSILKTAAAKKNPFKSKSDSDSKSKSQSSSGSDSKSKGGKKLTMKERMEKMRNMQKGKKGKVKKTEDKSAKKK